MAIDMVAVSPGRAPIIIPTVMEESIARIMVGLVIRPTKLDQKASIAYLLFITVTVS